jgi:3-hydroxybutyryl-CoA dehydrogenase
MSVKDKRVAVVGAGQMGTGIAHAFVTSGYDTILLDVDANQLERAKTGIAELVRAGVRLGKLSEADAAASLARLRTSSELSDCGGADLLVETVTERLDLKKQILSTAEPLLAPGAVLATNTSALSISEIAAAVQKPEFVVGMHFFNPVHKMKAVEIVRGIATADAVVALARDSSLALGKETITVNETPGLTTSRMSALLGNEAMYLLMEGAATAEDIDKALRLAFNHPMGPLELGDLTGWDTRLSALRYLHQTLGEKYRPCPLILKLVASGRLGRKVGHGVYQYTNGEKVPGSGLRASVL